MSKTRLSALHYQCDTWADSRGFFRVGDHKAGWCSSSHPPLWCDIIDLYHLITALQSSEMPLSELGLWAGSAPWDANELVCMLLN